jgi:cation diffusion facilitator CzcD-associated flavoprotein CzcO
VTTRQTYRANGVRDTTGVLHEVDTIIEATGFAFRHLDTPDPRPRWPPFADAAHASNRSGRHARLPQFFLLLGPNSAQATRPR